MHRFRLFLLPVALAFALSLPARATSCWVVTGWSSTSYVGAQALVSSTSCTTIPATHGWVHIDLSYGSPPTDDLWLRIALSDSRVSNWQFTPLLVFNGYDMSSKPIVMTDLIPSIPDHNWMWLLPYPPVQGVPVNGSRVRLRHLSTGKCAYCTGPSGAKTYNFDCWNDPNMVYVLDSAGGGQFRLRHEATGQCLYAVTPSGTALYHWGCWADPNMNFTLDPAGTGYRLHHVSTGQCAYGNTSNGGEIKTWGCWSDPNMVYKLDIIP